MPYIGANLPYKGWTTDTQFSVVTPSFSQDMYNKRKYNQWLKKIEKF